ncbi:Uncharacterised protein [Mycobacteroides abscessus subsp. abscessus]|nr:Uncharacterised protein [Mycobacteroides abscessus subsp. abscessus]
MTSDTVTRSTSPFADSIDLVGVSPPFSARTALPPRLTLRYFPTISDSFTNVKG